MRRIFGDPLFQFWVLGLVVFGLYLVLKPANSRQKDDAIVVSSARVAQFASVFERTRMRKPTVGELQGLIDGYVRQEVYVREARALGLDIDDEVIRRRLQLKLSFLTDSQSDALTLDDTELQAYLDNHPEEYRLEPRYGFEQILVGPESGSGTAHERAKVLLAKLTDDPSLDASALGAPTVLPAALPLTSTTIIARSFGAEFAEALSSLPAGVWAGPVGSAYGVHIVRITEQRKAEMPPLEDVHKQVLRDWMAQRRKDNADKYYENLRKKYRIVIETLAPVEPEAKP